MSIFTPYEKEEQALLLAQHLPKGKVWEKALDSESTLGKLVRALGTEFYRFQVLCEKMHTEMDINRADDLIIEWEDSVGIPDSCFLDQPAIEERRKRILQKFSNFGGAQTADDFVRIGAVFGFDLTVFPGYSVGTFPLEFPAVFFDTTKSATHTLFIQINNDLTSDSEFPLPFPMPFSSGGVGFLQCIFNKLAPANVKVEIIREGDL